MSALTKDDIKICCGIATTETVDDTLITNALNIAYATVGAYIEWDTTTDTYTERSYNDGRFWVTARANDVVLSHVYSVDGTGVETEITSDYYYAVGRAQWQLTTSYSFTSSILGIYNSFAIKISYTSASLTAALKEIVKAIAIFEFYRMPKKENSITVINRTTADIMQSFRKPIDFYADIDDRIRTLLLPVV